MSTKISRRSNDSPAYWAVIYAVADVDKSVAESIGKPYNGDVDYFHVDFSVNGVKLDFDEFVRRYDDRFNEIVKEAAREMLKDV